MKRLSVLAAALFSLALLAGCGGGDGATHNAQDATFAKGMVPHHEQAVVMSDLALSRAGSAEVKDLATRIKAAQAPEISTMKGWLGMWGEMATDNSGHDMASMSGMSGMQGMASDGDVAMMGRVSGAEFDRLFLTDMTAHHEGAVEMSKAEIAKGSFANAKTLAQRITAAQEKEIAEMKALLAKVG